MWWLLLTLSLAQTEPETAPPPAPAPAATEGEAEPAAKPKAAVSRGPTAAALPANLAKLPENEQVKGAARAFFTALLQSHSRAIVQHSGFPFFLEDRRIMGPDELLGELSKQLRRKRTDLLTLYGIDVYTPAEMEAANGKPPARLAQLPWKNTRTFIAVANVSGRPAVAIFRSPAPGLEWQVVAYHD